MRVSLVESPAILSMARYADHLCLAAQECGMEIDRWIPNSTWHRRQMMGNMGWKLPAWLWRYGWCPLAFRADADLVHVADHGWAHVVPRNSEIPVVVTCHDSMTLVEAEGRVPGVCPPPWRVWQARSILRRLENVNAVIVDSLASKTDLLKWSNVSENKISVVMPALDPFFESKPTPAEIASFRSRYKLLDRPSILHVGSTAAYKNISGLESIHDRLHSEMDSILVRIGSCLPQWESRQDIRQLGYLDDNELRIAYHACTAMCLPSWHEGFGWPVLEAQSCGLPVVCSNRGSLPEIHADPAFQFEPNDVEGMAMALRSVINNRSHCDVDCGRFSIEEFSHQINSVWNSVL